MKKFLFGTILLLILLLTTGCQKTIVGKWKSVDAKTEYYYYFNSDKTCSYEMSVARLDCNYEEDDNKLTILYDGNDNPSYFEYRFEGKTLIITDATGRDNKFIKEK